jgi:hypothetical protein
MTVCAHVSAAGANTGTSSAQHSGATAGGEWLWS